MTTIAVPGRTGLDDGVPAGDLATGQGLLIVGTRLRGVEVKITVEIEAAYREGFEAALQRTIKENCGSLKFRTANFERE